MFTTILAGVLLMTAPAQQKDTTFAVDPHGRLQIEDLRGDLQINTWDRPQARVETEPDNAERLRIDAGSSTVRVGFDRFRGNQGGDLHITIPATMAVRVAGNQGDVQIRGVQGEVSVEVISGDIELTGGRGMVSAHTVQGDIEVQDAQGRLDLATTSGDLQASGLAGDLIAKTVSGDIQLRRVDVSSADVSTVSGDLVYDGSVRERGEYSLKAHSGDVTLAAPQPMNATITVSTFNGDFQTDVPLHLTEQHGGKRFSFTLGSGSAHVQLESFSGDIHLARAGADAGTEH